MTAMTVTMIHMTNIQTLGLGSLEQLPQQLLQQLRLQYYPILHANLSCLKRQGTVPNESYRF